ncbi:MAG TPA: DUF1294 domain-containing protein [Clostridiaceae bacterium]|nr:DUF1294 domain-containing protein [Clostridiaceae bacterium]
MDYLWVILFAVLVINVFGFVLVGIDKYKAKKHRWRIPEKTFFIISILGGSPGVYIGLFTFKHKTRHISFIVGIPLIIALQLALLYYFLG